jgi:SAM-dependent methyltransferase
VTANKRTDAAAPFDQLAPGYTGGQEDALKRWAGEQDQFMEIKADWLLRRLGAASAGTGVRLLDYGCGTGTLMRLLRAKGLHAEMTGCDLSQVMLDEARRLWQEGDAPALHRVPAGRTPFADGAFDLTILCCVLHHVVPADRPGVFAELARVTRPGGRVVVFEHNPFNPLTQLVVRRCPIDAGVRLLSCEETRRGLSRAHWRALAVDYLMFLPPRWCAGASVARWLRWLPLGAQYVVTAIRA